MDNRITRQNIRKHGQKEKKDERKRSIANEIGEKTREREEAQYFGSVIQLSSGSSQICSVVLIVAVYKRHCFRIEYYFAVVGGAAGALAIAVAVVGVRLDLGQLVVVVHHRQLLHGIVGGVPLIVGGDGADRLVFLCRSAGGVFLWLH